MSRFPPPALARRAYAQARRSTICIIAPDAYPGFGKDLEDALDRLDRAVILGSITLPNYFERRDSIVAWLGERGVNVLPPEHSDTTAN